MALLTCAYCTAAYAVGLAACPQCGTATDLERPMPKINRTGPTYAATADEERPVPDPAPVEPEAPAKPGKASAPEPAAAEPEAAPSPPPAPGK